MNTEKIFITYDKNGNERLIYKKDENIYIDLLSKNNKIINLNDINIDTCIPYNIALKNKRKISRFNVIKLYKKDRNQQIDLQSIYLAFTYRVIKCEIKYYGNNYWNHGVEKNYSALSNQFSLFQRIKQNEYLNLKTNEILPAKLHYSDIEVDALYVSVKDENRAYKSSEGYRTKKYILEDYHRQLENLKKKEEQNKVLKLHKN